MESYDFVVIGGGSAGYSAAAAATRSGLKTVCIEGGDQVGGLCILRGCMPSKTFIESANRFMTLRRASGVWTKRRTPGVRFQGDYSAEARIDLRIRQSQIATIDRRQI